MAKRVRGSSSRPGQRAPLQRPTPSSAASATTASRPPTLTPEEEARAAELEAQLVAEDRAAESTRRRERERAQRSTDATPAGPRGSLVAGARDEYAYVARDIRRIAILGGSLIVVLFIIWAIVEATGIGPF